MQYRKLATASRILEHNQSGGKATQKALWGGITMDVHIGSKLLNVKALTQSQVR